MKKQIIPLLFAVASLLSGCNEKDSFGGEGQVLLSASIDPTVRIIESRADITDEETLAYLNSTLELWVSQVSAEGNKLVRRYTKGEIPSGTLKLFSGNYLAEAWAGDSVSASWDKKWFKAATNFTISQGVTTDVTLKCSIANVAVSIIYDEDVKELLSDYSFSIGHERGRLDFDAEHVNDVAYFMMPSTDKDLSWTLTGKKVYEGNNTLTVSDKIVNAKPGYQYVFHVSCTPRLEQNAGGARIMVHVNEEEIVQKESVKIDGGPVIKGYMFDINQQIVSTLGMLDHKSVWVFGASQLKSVKLTVPQTILNTYDKAIDLANPTESERQALENVGIYVIYPYYPEETPGVSESVSMKILFDEELTKKLPVGEYQFGISATDGTDQTTNKSLMVKITDESVEIYDLDVRNWHNPVLRGHILKPDVNPEEIQFCVKEVGSSNVSVFGVEVDGENFSASVSGLTVGANYEFTASVGDFTTKPKTFTMADSRQLPNAGFEGWQTSSSPYLLYAAGEEKFWDSGNHGSATLNKNITTPDESIKHGGNYSAKLSSEYIVMKFAAGNAFLGDYLKTDGTDGVIGFGRPFSCCPTKIRCYVKYRPVTIDRCPSGTPSEYAKGNMDIGIIYAALLDDNTDSEYSQYPVVVKTKTKQLFDPSSEHVLAYAEWTSNQNTAGDGLVEIEIPFDYRRTDTLPSYIMLTASSSKGGDYFAGGDGSTMWIDDIELVYE